MPNDDYIKRSDVCPALRKWICCRPDERTMECVIDDIPAADVEPKRKTGQWIKSASTIHTPQYAAFIPHWYCPECGTEYDPAVAEHMIKYCYVCGTRIINDTKEESND